MDSQEGFPIPQGEEFDVVASGNWELARPAGISSMEDAGTAVVEPGTLSETDAPDPSASSE